MKILKEVVFTVLLPLICSLLSLIFLGFTVLLIQEGLTPLRVIMIPTAFYLYMGSAFSGPALWWHQPDEDLKSMKFILSTIAISIFALPYLLRHLNKK